MLRAFSFFVIGVMGMVFWAGGVGALEIGSPVDKEAFAVQEEIRFIAETSLPDTTVTWNFGDGKTATGHVVYHTYEEANWYTVTATSDDGGSESVTIAVVKVESVTIEKASVCAGGIDSSVHKSNVTVQIFPAVAYDKLNIELRNGIGWTGGISQHYFNPVGTLNYGGPRVPARLTIGGQTIEGAQSAPRVTISTDSGGKAEGDIRSSNKVDDNAVVYAAVGPDDASNGETSITFGEPDLQIQLPDELSESFNIVIHLSYQGQGVDGHQIQIAVMDVQAPKKITPTQIGEMKTLPRPQWTRYVSHLQLVASSDTGTVTTGILQPDYSRTIKGFWGSVVKYGAYDNTAYKAGVTVAYVNE